VSTPLENEIATAVNLLALSDALVRLPACSGSRGHPASDETLVEAFGNYQLGIASSSAAAPLWNSYKSALQRLDDLRARKDAIDTAVAAVLAAAAAADVITVELRTKIAAVDVTATGAPLIVAEAETVAKAPVDADYAIETVLNFMASCSWRSDLGRDLDSLRAKENKVISF